LIHYQSTAVIAVSVVSHCHGEQLLQLLLRLQSLSAASISQVLITFNMPEPQLADQLNRKRWTFELKLIENKSPKGYGANHNAAFEHCYAPFFCVINPDIDFDKNPFPELQARFVSSRTGCVVPIQRDEDGNTQDYARELPSPFALLGRYAGGRKARSPATEPDWVNGAFLLFRSEIYGLLRGFDERYFMYCEDVDICLRLKLAGYQLAQAGVSVVHPAHRSSRVKLRFLAWHITSLLRLWCSSTYWAFYRSKV
jgi:N-acetylglucosaminyl-diphospho-decaprenol L-rhamnosyltransferase